MKLKNKTVLITGASQGLGKTLSYKIADLGAKIILVSRTESELKKLRESILKVNGKADYIICDISSLASVKNATTEIKNRFSDIDVLINNAGIWTDNSQELKSPNKKKEAFDTNALGNIQFTDEFLSVFEERNSGHIFNVISTSGRGDIFEAESKLWATYAATKWAFAGYTKALQDRFQHTKVKVTGFFPGGFDSNFYEIDKSKNAQLMPWMMNKEDIADVVIFVLTRSDDMLIKELVVTKVV